MSDYLTILVTFVVGGGITQLLNSLIAWRKSKKDSVTQDTEVEELEARIREAVLKDFREHYAWMSEQNSSMRERINDLAAEIKSVREQRKREIDDLETEVQRLRDENETMREANDEKSRRIAELEAKVEALELLIKELGGVDGRSTTGRQDC